MGHRPVRRCHHNDRVFNIGGLHSAMSINHGMFREQTHRSSQKVLTVRTHAVARKFNIIERAFRVHLLRDLIARLNFQIGEHPAFGIVRY